MNTLPYKKNSFVRYQLPIFVSHDRIISSRIDRGGTARPAPQSIRPGRSAPRPPQTRSFRLKFGNVPPQVLGRSAPTPHIQWRRLGGARQSQPGQGTFHGCKVLIGVQFAG